jgi:PPM family protein phosphatase
MEVHGLSHPGNVRASNEDAMTWDLDLGFVAVADGMGGHQAGEVASSLALDAILSFIRKSAATNDFTWPFGVNPRLSLTANRLGTAIKIGNRRVFKRSEEVPDYVGMGTTVVALVADGSRVTFASVGDSRIYAFKEGTLRQLTRDDSWVVMLAEEQGVTPETLRTHPMRNVLTNVVGARPELEIQAAEIDLEHETLLLCSDGLHTSLSSEEITEVLVAESDLQRAAKALIRNALERDGKDNITAVLVRLSATDQDTRLVDQDTRVK